MHAGRTLEVTVARPDEGAASGPEPWNITLLDRFAAFGIPLGMALLPWGRVAAFAGQMVLAPFAVAIARVPSFCLLWLGDIRRVDPTSLTLQGTAQDFYLHDQRF